MRIREARLAFDSSNQGAFERQSARFHTLSNSEYRRGEAAEAARSALAAGERRIAEVAGTEFEAGWREAVMRLRALFSEWEAQHPEATA